MNWTTVHVDGVQANVFIHYLKYKGAEMLAQIS